MNKRLTKIVIFVIMLLWITPLSLYLYNKEQPLTYPYTAKTIIQEHIKDERLATAIANSKFPAQLAGIAIRENAKFKTHLTSDKGESYGYFMIQKKHWGKFGKTPEQQVAKAEEVFETLVRTHDPTKAHMKWNGSGKDAKIYQAKLNRLIVKIQEG